MIYWKSPEDLEKQLRPTPPPAGAERNTDVSYPNSPSRREFLQWMSALTALLGTSACSRQPWEPIIPYQKAPEQIIPGVPLFYATAATFGGYAKGILVENHMGRPTKVEGNPDHPMSLGATDVFAQAAILDLYDPDRSGHHRYNSLIGTWDNFIASVGRALEKQSGKGGSGLRILTETVTSPTFASQMRNLLQKFPKARWHRWEPVHRDNVSEGAKLAFGVDVEPHYRFDAADVIVSLDSDFLYSHPASTRYARDFMSRRHVEAGPTVRMNRLYMVESTHSVTGASADHRLVAKARDVEKIAQALASAMGIGQANVNLPPAQAKWIHAMAKDLQRAGGAAVVVAGESQPPHVHALAHAMNQSLGAVGKTVTYLDPAEVDRVNHSQSLAALVQDMNGGQVDLVVILGGNPVYTAPADLKFAEALAKVPFRAHLSLYDNETSKVCSWHLSQTHFLETWGDALAFDGTATIQQPMILPLYEGRSAYEVLSVLLGEPGKSAHDIVQNYWKSQLRGDFEKSWRRALHDGILPNTATAPRRVTARNVASLPRTPSADANGMEIVFRPDPCVWDGRFSNNAWLQELPKPLTKLVWDNAAYLSPATANRLGVRDQEMLQITVEGRKLDVPALVVPGQPEDSITLGLGYGRELAGRIGNGMGFNAYRLRSTSSPWFATGEVKKAGGSFQLAVTHEHWDMEGRDIVRSGSFADYEKDPHFLHHEHDRLRPPQQFPPFPVQNADYQWGMVINLSTCIGCNACVIGCQSENNIPVTGKDQVTRYREMHWLRIDRYYTGSLENPQTHWQPVPCMHCENAPCEQVCPVGATNHSDDGMNNMVYNRCVGTRYCSNNCPYKVRRFNFYEYGDHETPVLKLMRNPDVTVRGRGVMEKCSYCVQRIQEAKITSEKEGRKLRDGEILTACQQACPTQAIVFGNILDPNSEVSKLKAQPLNYGLLTELNTRPRTTYLAGVRNYNPELMES